MCFCLWSWGFDGLGLWSWGPCGIDLVYHSLAFDFVMQTYYIVKDLCKRVQLTRSNCFPQLNHLGSFDLIEKDTNKTIQLKKKQKYNMNLSILFALKMS